MLLQPRFRRLVAALAIVISPIAADAVDTFKAGRLRAPKPSVDLVRERAPRPGADRAAKPGPQRPDPKGPTQTYSGPRDVLVELDASRVRKRADALRSRRKLEHDDEGIRAYKRNQYARLQRRFTAAGKGLGVRVKRTYRNFPALAVRIERDEDVARLERRGDVVAVHENIEFVPLLAESLPQVGQPNAADAGARGRGTSVAVLDTGVDLTDPAFGSCTAPGQPAECRVALSHEFALPDDAWDDDGHGTNVAGIVVGMAPETNILALDVFDQSPLGPVTNVLGLAAAIDFVIDTKFFFNTVAMNLSLGAPNMYSRGRCLSPMDPLFAEAQAVGVMPIVAAGNESDPGNLLLPACSPWAVTVGAVDESDAVTTFSNSSIALDLLAPGTSITAAGFTMTGTSMATPHVAGAWAVMRGFRSDLDQHQVLQALKDTGVPITDPRQGRITPRIQLDRALTWAPYPVLPATFENHLNLAPRESAWASCQMQELADGFACGWNTVVESFTSEDLCGMTQVTSEAACGLLEVTSEFHCGMEWVVDAFVCGVTEIVLNPFEVLPDMQCVCEGLGCTCEIPNQCLAPATCDIEATCEVEATCSLERDCDPNVETCDPLSCEVMVCEF